MNAMNATKLVRGRWVIPGAEDAVLVDGAVLVEGHDVATVDDWQRLRERFPDAEVVGSENVAVLPGLINAHHHSKGVSTIQHGIADMLLEPWILSHRRARSGDPYLEALLSAAEQLRSGVTTVVNVLKAGGDAEAFSDTVRETMKGYDRSGMRAVTAAGFTTQSYLVSGAGEDERFIASLPEAVRANARMMLPQDNRISEDEYFQVMESIWQEYRDHPRVGVWFGPPGPQWVSDAFMTRIAEHAERWDVGIQTHVDESIYEMIHGPRFYGKHTMLHLNDLGVLSPRFSIAHGVWLTEEEIAVMVETGASVSHNPSSNLRLRAGIAPLNGLLEAGANVALGMDGTTLGEDEDMFAEMRLAMRLHGSPVLGEPAPAATDILTIATRGGARLMRQEGRLGRIARGHAADLVLVNLDRMVWPWIAPEADPRSVVLYRARAADVDTVLVDGEVVLRAGMPTRFDIQAVGRQLAERLDAEPYPKDDAETVAQLLPHLEAWYRRWQIPTLEPWIRYNSRR
jgi:cytosine/adenosine deaminase-related metal-dependent hydrolase